MQPLPLILRNDKTETQNLESVVWRVSRVRFKEIFAALNISDDGVCAAFLVEAEQVLILDMRSVARRWLCDKGQ
jgi:hypothetical protein